METGYWSEGVRVKENATPIDNVTKFAWEESDFEPYREWIEYSPQQQLDFAKGVLVSTDYIMIKAMEELFSINSLSDLLSVLRNYRTTYRASITQRIEARMLINSLEQNVNAEQEEQNVQ